ncbi:MAG: hypothetical protein O2894_05315 [Planctomycetota bacterium]|nr:hypothetical protein [Planctomycetota bacterium]
MSLTSSASHAARRPLLLALTALLALPLVIGGDPAPRHAEAGAPPLSWTYRDRVHKFSLKMFKDYESIPLKTDEKTVVAKFGDPKSKGANRGSYPIAIEVVRVALEGQGGAVTTGAAETDAERIQREMMERFGMGPPKDVWSVMMSTLRGWRLDDTGATAVEKEREQFKKITSKDKEKVPGKLWQFNAPIVNPYDKEQMHVTCAEFTKEGWSYGIVMTCGTKLEKSYASSFKKIATSFEWFDKDAKDVEALDVLEGVNITAKKRSEIERTMVRGWDAIVSSKKNYIVLYNTKNGKNHLLAKVIAERIEAIREQVYEVQFPPAKPITTVCIVRVCKDAKEYREYGGPGGSAGYWSSRDEELVFYDASASKKPDDDTLSVLYHEAFHQYIFYSVGNVAPHSWFNEGHGDYYAGAKYKGGKFFIEPFDWRVGTVRGAIVEGPRECTVETNERGEEQRRWGGKGYTPLEHLVRFTQGEYYSYPGVSYAQGLALIYFLREIVPKNRKYKEKWGKILDTYFDVLQAEVNREEPEVPIAVPEEGDPRPKDDGPGADEPKDDEPKDDEPGKDAPGDEDGDEDEGDPEPPNPDEPLPDVARIFFTGRGGPNALKKAVDEAFKDIDWVEFEAAWVEATKRGK